MAHAVLNVILGYQPHNHIKYFLNDMDIENYQEAGFEALYNSDGCLALYSGIRLHHVEPMRENIDLLRSSLSPTPEQRQQTQELMSQTRQRLERFIVECDPEQKEELMALLPDKPKLFLMWSST